MTNKVIRPDDILADDKDFLEFNGLAMRKGSIAAFLKNIELFEDQNSTDFQKKEAMEMIKELGMVVIATGLHKHATFKNTVIEELLNSLQATKINAA